MRINKKVTWKKKIKFTMNDYRLDNVSDPKLRFRPNSNFKAVEKFKEVQLNVPHQPGCVGYNTAASSQVEL